MQSLQTTTYKNYCDTLVYLNSAFTVMFSIECVLKILAFGPKVGYIIYYIYAYLLYGGDWVTTLQHVHVFKHTYYAAKVAQCFVSSLYFLLSFCGMKMRSALVYRATNRCWLISNGLP